VLNDTGNETRDAGTEVYETYIHTEALTIRVKPVPEKNRPANFNGAAGNFTIATYTPTSELGKNEEGFLEIKISGKGNFIQLSAPSIQWPDGIEGFDPVITDAFDKTQTPLTGSRTFRFPFVSARPAVYTIPATSFSFFNTDSGKYKTISTNAFRVNVNNTEKPVTTRTTETTVTKKQPATTYIIAGIAVILLGFTGMYWLRRKKQKQVLLPVLPGKEIISIDDLLAPAGLLRDDDRKFYSALQQAAWRFFGHHFNLSGSGMDKKELVKELQKKGTNEGIIQRLIGILNTCEAGMFTSASMGVNKEALLRETRELLQDTERLLV
jgi:hypothetical protein